MINEKENKKKYSLDYDELDEKIEVEICGLKFEMNINEIEKVKSENEEKISVEEEINKILGRDAINRINEKRLKDGYDELNSNGLTRIIGFIMSIYTEVCAKNVIDKVKKSADTIANEVNNFSMNNMNRAQKRNYNRQNNYRRGYRRY